MTAVSLPIETEEPRSSKKLTRSGFAWAMLECGRFPYLQLISGIVFMPYFASVIVGDAVEGQAQVANYGKIAGLIAACTAPLLGASLDYIGPRKPWIAGSTAIMVVLLATLWYAQPGSVGLSIGLIVSILVCVKVLYAYTEVMHNSMLLRAVDGGSVSRLSATSFGLGYISALVTLSGFLWAFALPGQYDLPWVPDQPLFGLDPAKYEHIRIAGPIAATALALAILPLLFLTRDHAGPGLGVIKSVSAGFTYLKGLPRHLRKYPNAALFIFSRMVYADGTAAMTLFLGVYAAGVMRWGPVELLVLGIIKLSLALTGSFLSVFLEERLGSKRAVQIALVGIVIVLGAVIGTGPQQIFFFWHGGALAEPVWDFPIFSTLPELLFLLFCASTAMFMTVISSGSRSLLTKLTPVQETGAFFGLYALASSATAWLAPMLIEYFTRLTGTQQGGFAPVVLFFIAGLIGLSFVKYRETY